MALNETKPAHHIEPRFQQKLMFRSLSSTMTDSTKISNMALLLFVLCINGFSTLLAHFNAGLIIRQVEQLGPEYFCTDSFSSHARQALTSALECEWITCASPAATTFLVTYIPSDFARAAIVVCWMLGIVVLHFFKRKDVAFWVQGLGGLVLGVYYATGAWETYTLLGIILASNMPILGFLVHKYLHQSRS